MQQVPVKLYGLFGKFQPVEYQIDEDISQQLNIDSLLDVENHCYEICSLFKSGPQLFVNDWGGPPNYTNYGNQSLILVGDRDFLNRSPN